MKSKSSKSSGKSVTSVVECGAEPTSRKSGKSAAAAPLEIGSNRIKYANDVFVAIVSRPFSLCFRPSDSDLSLFLCSFAKGGRPGKCFEDTSATNPPDSNYPIISACDLNNPAQVSDFQPVAGTLLPIFQIRANATGYARCRSRQHFYAIVHGSQNALDCHYGIVHSELLLFCHHVGRRRDQWCRLLLGYFWSQQVLVGGPYQ